MSATRRQALGRAALGAGALAATGLAGTLARPRPARAQSTDDEELRDFLVPAIALEQIAALAYGDAAEARATSGELKQTFERLRDHEQAHANALRSALESLGFDRPDPPESATDTGVLEDVEGLDEKRAGELTELLGGLDRLEGERELLEYLAGLEDEQIAYYLEALPGLDSEDLGRTGAEIIASQAQHLVVLRLALGDDQVAATAAVGAGGTGGGQGDDGGGEAGSG